VKSGVLPFLTSIIFHLSIVGGSAYLVHNIPQMPGGGQKIESKPVFITLVQESPVQAPTPEVAEPTKERQKQEKTPKQVKPEPKNEIKPTNGTAPLPQPTLAEKEEKADKSEEQTPTPTNTQAQKPLQNTPPAEKQAGEIAITALYQGGSGQAKIRYQDQVRAAINAHRIYPRQARRLGMEGDALIQLDIMRDGTIRSYHLIESTGHHVLDRAAHTMVTESLPLPRVPQSIQKTPVVVNVPLTFQLKDQ